MCWVVLVVPRAVKGLHRQRSHADGAVRLCAVHVQLAAYAGGSIAFACRLGSRLRGGAYSEAVPAIRGNIDVLIVR